MLVAKKDYNAPKHHDIDVPNLQVIKALQSLDSRGFVKTQFDMPQLQLLGPIEECFVTLIPIFCENYKCFLMSISY